MKIGPSNPLFHDKFEFVGQPGGIETNSFWFAGYAGAVLVYLATP